MESGPVNLEQLQLENANNSNELQLRNEAVIAKRRALVDATRKKSKVLDKIKADEKRYKENVKQLIESELVFGKLKLMKGDVIEKINVKQKEVDVLTKKLELS